MAFDGHARARSSSRDDPSNYNQDDYERGRQRIDLKLKGTFERIFEKYARDFSGVGDEIDLETGELVIDNGHLTYMQHERDTGKSASSRFVRAFADELEVEDGDGEDAVDEEEEDDDDDDELSDEDSQEEDQHHKHVNVDEGEDEDAGDEAGDEQSGDESDDLGREQTHLVLDPRLAQSDTSVSQEQQYHNTSIIPSTEVTQSLLPQISIADSLNQLVPHQDSQGRINPEAIHQLGQSIANQIAQFLVQATTSNSRQPQGIWSAPPLPQDSFNRPLFFDNHRSALTPAPHRAPSVWESPSGGPSLWASTASRPKKRRRLLKHTETSFNLDPALDHDHGFSDATSTSRAKQNRVYSREEDELIKRLKEINGLTWQQITAHLPGRSTGGLSGRYTRVLKDLPRPVIVKREIIEIMDGDELSSPAPADVANSPGRSPFHTPLLRRAMENQVARQGDNGEMPITIGDDAEDTDSLRESSTPPPQTQMFSDGRGGYYRLHPLTGAAAPTIYMSESPELETPQDKPKKHAEIPRVAAARYRTFDTSNPVGNFGMLRSNTPVPYAPEEHNLNLYGTTSGFGVLRMSKPPKPKKQTKSDGPRRQAVSQTGPGGSDASQATSQRWTHPASQPRDNLANTTANTINSFARAEQVERAGPAHNLQSHGMTSFQVNLTPTASRAHTGPDVPQSGNTFDQPMSIHPLHPPPPYSARPPVKASTSLASAIEPMPIDTENDGDVSDTSAIEESPVNASRYLDTPGPALRKNNGPYFLSNLPPPPPSPFVPTTATTVAPQARMRLASSPLSSPPSSPPRVLSPRSPSTTASQKGERRNSTQKAKSNAPSSDPSRMSRKSLDATTSTRPKEKEKKEARLATPVKATAKKREITPVRATVEKRGIVRKREIMAPVDDGSEDELA